MSGMLDGDPSRPSSVMGLLSSHAHLHSALMPALGGRCCEQCHLKDVENEARRCSDTCPRPHSQDEVELGPNPGLRGPRCVLCEPPQTGL